MRRTFGIGVAVWCMLNAACLCGAQEIPAENAARVFSAEELQAQQEAAQALHDNTLSVEDTITALENDAARVSQEIEQDQRKAEAETTVIRANLEQEYEQLWKAAQDEAAAILRSLTIDSERAVEQAIRDSLREADEMARELDRMRLQPPRP